MRSPPPPLAPILVVGVGNVLLTDDGVGVFLARELARRELANVEVLDGGTLGLTLLSYLAGREAVVLLDAARGDTTGALLWQQWPLAASWFYGHGLSPHEGSALELLAAAELTGALPPQVWLGTVTVQEVSTRVGLSHALRKRFPSLVEEVVSFLHHLRSELDAKTSGFDSLRL